ncbi:MAG: hypothetical protein QOD32_2837 [Pyrinomonadaceae bacterium]|jgi:hypothetical protein|nr:hypothetical protein [Pyrinomonadaceae bacterium]
MEKTRFLPFTIYYLPFTFYLSSVDPDADGEVAAVVAVVVVVDG